jgi:PPE-repeat protein
MNVTSEIPALSTDAEFGVLDALLALAKNSKKLIAVPLLAGAVFYGLSCLTPKSYTSVAILRSMSSGADAKGDVNAAEILLRSASVLNSVAAQFSFEGANLEERQKALARKISITKIRGEPAVTLSVSSGKPETAKNIVTALVTAWLPFLKPSSSELQLVDTRIKAAESDKAFLEVTVKKFEQDFANKDTPIALVSLYGMQRENKKELANLKASLIGLSFEDVVISDPTLPDEAQNTSWYWGPIAALFAAALLLTDVIFNAYIERSGQNAAGAQKLAEFHGFLLPWRRKKAR